MEGSASAIEQELELAFTILKLVPVHHRLDWERCLVGVLCGLLSVVGIEDFAFNEEVNELAHRHAFVDAHGLFHGDFERPVVAEADVALTRSGVDVDAESADT